MTEATAGRGQSRTLFARPSAIGTVVLSLLALVALWFSVRTTLQGLLERDYPALGAEMRPPSPISQALIALNRASVKQGVADPLARELLESALRRAPMLSEPFIVAGLDASARNDFVRAEKLMEEARHRDPRTVIPRFWLFDNYLREGKYAKGIAEAQPLIRLQPAAEPAAVAVLTALVDMPAGRAALLPALRARPTWRRAFFEQTAESGRLRGDAVAMLLATTPDGATWARREFLAVMRALVRADDYTGAYALWLRTVPRSQRPGTPGLYDGGFAGTLGGQPFGWRLPQASSGAVQIQEAADSTSRSGLAIRTEGDRPIVLAEQLVLATPGEARLRFATRALEDAGPSDAGLRVEVRCAATRKVIARDTVRSFSASLTERSVPISLSPGCGAALISFSVAPGMEPGPINALLTNVSYARS